MMVPARPMAHLIVRSPGFALAALEAFFNAMFGFGDLRTLPKRCLRRRVGQIIIDLHDPIVVALTVAYHHHQLLIALLTPMGARHHPSFDAVTYQWPFRPIAYINAPPGFLVKRLTPRRHALPGTIGPSPSAARLG